MSYRFKIDAKTACAICTAPSRTKTQIEGVFRFVCDKCWDAATKAVSDTKNASAVDIFKVVRTMYRLSKGLPI